MESKSLFVKYIDSEGNERFFPNDQHPLVLSTWTYERGRMSSYSTIQGTNVKHPLCLDDMWVKDVFVDYNGLKCYISDIPSSQKSTESHLFSYTDITFKSLGYKLDNIFFFDVVTDDTELQYKDRYRSNNTAFSFYGKVDEFVARINDSLIYSKLYDKETDEGFKIVIDEGVVSEEKEISFEQTYITDVIKKIYDEYKIPYYWIGNVCHVGYGDSVIDRQFEYGENKGLISISRTNKLKRIINNMTGIGSSENIPFYYPNDTPAGIALFNTQNVEKNNVSVSLDSIFKYDVSPYGKPFVLCRQIDEDINDFYYAESSQDGLWVHSLDGYWYEGNRRSRLQWKADPLGGYIEHKIDKIYDRNKRQYESISIRLIVWFNKGINYMTIGNMFLCFGRSQKGALDDAPYEERKMLELTEVNTRIDYRKYPVDSIGFQNYNKQEFLIEEEGYYTIDIYRTFGYYFDINEILWDSDIKLRFQYQIRFNWDTPNGSKYFFKYDNKNIDYLKSGISISTLSSCPCNVYNRKIDINGKIIETEEISDNPATITVTGRNYILPSQNLMPSIYRQSMGAERFYKALNNQTDSAYIKDDGTSWEFENEYNDKNPMDGYVSNDEIKPTIKGITNEHGQLFGEIADVAFDISDSDKQKDDGTYIHSYFYVRLNIFNGQYGFNLFKQGIENGAMTLNMTSGNCAGCAFEVAVSEDKELVDGKYEFKNPVAVDDDGNLIKVGTLNDTDEGFVGDYIYSNTADYRVRQQDTSKHSVWIALKKEYGTFGVVMPNATNNYKPNIGDTFTISNIALPKQYILNAEDRLSKFIVENMFENNTEEFSYSIKFSRIYLEQNKDILPHLNENTRLTISYNGHNILLYVSTFQLKVDGNILSDIVVELNKELSIEENSLKKQASAITSELENELHNLDFYAIFGNSFLRKDIKDKAKGHITFDGGITSTKDSNFKRISATESSFDKADVKDISIEKSMKIDAPIDSSKDYISSNKLLRADRGVQFGSSFADGVTGLGGYINEYGVGYLRSLELAESLTVPELNYNRINVNVGFDWRASGGGIIDNVIMDVDSNGNELTTGTATIKLEDGEIGSIALDDLCLGIWHNTKGDNDKETSDDYKGNYTFAGFQTCYFRIIEATGDNNNSIFKFALRSGYKVKPQKNMRFVCFGNPTNEKRQSSEYSTTKYTRFLRNVTTWEYRIENIGMQFGDLENLMVYGVDMKGYSVFAQNMYLTGHIAGVDSNDCELVISGINDTITVGENRKIDMKLMSKGYEVSDALFDISRDSGDADADAIWNEGHKGLASTIYLSSDDMGEGGYVNPVMFIFTGTSQKDSAITSSTGKVIRLVTQEQMYITFSSNKGQSLQVYYDNVDIAIEARLMYGEEDITDSLVTNKSDTQVVWTRDSGNINTDKAWIPTIGDKKNILLIEDKVNGRHDCGDSWQTSLQTTFKCEITVNIGNSVMKMSADLNVGI